MKRCFLLLALCCSFSLLVGSAFGQDADTASVEAPELREEILEMVETDQRYRDYLEEEYGFGEVTNPEDQARLDSLVETHADRMKEIIRAHGWPGHSLVGPEAAQGAWLLVQHADHDPGFQWSALSFLEEAVEAGEADPQDLAYLTDRVRLAQGLDQIYGTQVEFVDGEPVPFPILEEEEVDARRAEMGLEPLEEYLDRLRTQPQ